MRDQKLHPRMALLPVQTVNGIIHDILHHKSYRKYVLFVKYSSRYYGTMGIYYRDPGCDYHWSVKIFVKRQMD